jgi:hypothetical protein
MKGTNDQIGESPSLIRAEKGSIMIFSNATFELNHACQEFAELILSLSEGQFSAPMSGWSPQGIVSHLVGWNGLMIEASLSILAGKAPFYYDDAPNDYSHINAIFTQKYALRSKQELLAELKSSMEKFEAFISTLPAEELTADHGVNHYRGSPASVAKTIKSLAGDYQYHIRQIREWFKQ